MLNVSVFCFFASYLVAFLLELTRLKVTSRFALLAKNLFLAAGFVAHTMYLVVRAGHTQLPPLLSSTHDWLLVLAWLVVLVHLVFSLADPHLPMGIFVQPVILLLVGASWGLSTRPNRLLDAWRGWTMLHATTLVLGILCVVTGFLLSIMFLWQHQRLKSGAMLQQGLKLPSLERLARLNRWALVSSVPFLTVGMASGVLLAVWKRPEEMSLTWTDPIVIAGIAGWLLMCGLLVWLIGGERPPARQVALLTTWACGFLLFTLVGLQLLTSSGNVPGVHQLNGGSLRADVAVPLIREVA